MDSQADIQTEDELDLIVDALFGRAAELPEVLKAGLARITRDYIESGADDMRLLDDFGDLLGEEYYTFENIEPFLDEILEAEERRKRRAALTLVDGGLRKSQKLFH